jgi:NADPH:quinone reductase-like Zn-dependent oxidoreductase
MRAVRFDEYGGIGVLDVREVEDPRPGPGRVVVRVRATGLNPGEIPIREGAFHERAPATFPSGEGTDLAGEVAAVADGESGFAVGDAVLGWTDDRAAHAELVSVPAEQVIAKPPELRWEVAGALFVVSLAALASVRAVAPQAGETVVVSAAAGGVGSVAVQLARRTGATVIGLAGDGNHEWLRAHDVVPVAYGDGQAERIREASGGSIDAFIDTFGGGYVELALELGVAPERINTIIDFQAAGRHDGVHTEGTYAIASPEPLAEMAALVAAGELEIPIARTYPLDRVREAYAELAERHTRGKIVLVP